MNLLDLLHWRKSTAPSITFRMAAPAQGETIHQVVNFPAVIGRSDDADLQLPDRLASRIHCILKRQGTRFVLRDLESRHGTWINGQRINEQALEVADEIWLGTTQLIVMAIVTPCGSSSQDVKRL